MKKAKEKIQAKEQRAREKAKAKKQRAKAKGIFITFEGGEGAGKSTLIKKIGEKLQKEGFTVTYTREPGGTKLAEKIRELLLHSKEYHISHKTELFLFLSARIDHIEQVIKPALDKGNIVLCDRFSDSTIAYQGVARGLGINYTKKLCKLAQENIIPDLTFLIDIETQEGFKRIKTKRKEKQDRMESEQQKFHEKVRKGFLQLAKNEPKRIIIINGMLPKEEVVRLTYKKIQQRVK